MDILAEQLTGKVVVGARWVGGAQLVLGFTDGSKLSVLAQRPDGGEAFEDGSRVRLTVLV
jgi:hypothetical protein